LNGNLVESANKHPHLLSIAMLAFAFLGHTDL
jgi:hypothetical protein